MCTAREKRRREEEKKRRGPIAWRRDTYTRAVSRGAHTYGRGRSGGEAERECTRPCGSSQSIIWRSRRRHQCLCLDGTACERARRVYTRLRLRSHTHIRPRTSVRRSLTGSVRGARVHTHARAQTERCSSYTVTRRRRRRRDVHVRDTRGTRARLDYVKATRPGYNAIKRPTNRGGFAFRLPAQKRDFPNAARASRTAYRGGNDPRERRIRAPGRSAELAGRYVTRGEPPSLWRARKRDGQREARLQNTFAVPAPILRDRSSSTRRA